MSKPFFTTAEQGFNILITEYLGADVSGGEFIEYYLKHNGFHQDVNQLVQFHAVCKFLNWDNISVKYVTDEDLDLSGEQPQE